LREQISVAIYRMSEVPAAHIPIEPFKGPPSRGGRMWGWQKTKRAQQKHNFPRWRSEECSRNEWSFPSVPLALFSSSDRMFVFRKIDRNEIRPLLARECSALSFAIVTAIFLTDARMHSQSILFLPYKTIRAFTSKTTADLRKYRETRVKPTCPVAPRS